MTRTIDRRAGRRGRAVGAPALTLAAIFIAACGSTPNDPTGAVSVTVKPGDTGTCDTNPCQVSLVMPPGTGSFEVTGNETRIGDFPAGQTVNLGQFFGSQSFKIPAANVPAAYVYIPRGP